MVNKKITFIIITLLLILTISLFFVSALVSKIEQEQGIVEEEIWNKPKTYKNAKIEDFFENNNLNIEMLIKNAIIHEENDKIEVILQKGGNIHGMRVSKKPRVMPKENFDFSYSENAKNKFVFNKKGEIIEADFETRQIGFYRLDGGIISLPTQTLVLLKDGILDIKLPESQTTQKPGPAILGDFNLKLIRTQGRDNKEIQAHSSAIRFIGTLIYDIDSGKYYIEDDAIIMDLKVETSKRTNLYLDEDAPFYSDRDFLAIKVPINKILEGTDETVKIGYFMAIGTASETKIAGPKITIDSKNPFFTSMQEGESHRFHVGKAGEQEGYGMITIHQIPGQDNPEIIASGINTIDSSLFDKPMLMKKDEQGKQSIHVVRPIQKRTGNIQIMQIRPVEETYFNIKTGKSLTKTDLELYSLTVTRSLPDYVMTGDKTIGEYIKVTGPARVVYNPDIEIEGLPEIHIVNGIPMAAP